MPDTPTLAQALAAVKSHRAGLPADDPAAVALDVLIAQVEAHGDLEPGGSMSVDDLGGFA